MKSVLLVILLCAVGNSALHGAHPSKQACNIKKLNWFECFQLSVDGTCRIPRHAVWEKCVMACKDSQSPTSSQDNAQQKCAVGCHLAYTAALNASQAAQFGPWKTIRTSTR